MPLPLGLSSVGLLLVGRGELEPALGTTSLKDQASALRLHSRAKAELASPADLAGLVGSLHVPGSLSTMGDGRLPNEGVADRFEGQA